MNWQEKIKEYCSFYNIPIEYLSDTLYEPKVIPMIRGKAFEFTTFITLKEILPPDEFDVSKESMNAQIDSHDIDVAVRHIPTDITLSIECKLAGKGRFRFLENSNEYKLNVKCMRSRTLGSRMVTQQAAKLGLDVEQLTTHNDSYRASDFDVVITSIGNVFYVTREDGIFDWKPSKTAQNFLMSISSPDQHSNLKDFAFNSMFLAHSYDLAPHANNQIQCTRRNCNSKADCGFIPNYPELSFQNGNKLPDHPWYHINDAASVLRKIALLKKNRT